jgi:ketosteroid isomerase-like protein
MEMMRFVIPVVALALALPAYAQQVDQQTRQQADAIVSEYIGAINKGDGQAVAALFAPNPISITPTGKRTSGEQMRCEIEGVHKWGMTISAKVDQVMPLVGGQEIAATAPYQGTFANDPGSPQVKGNFLFVLERSGDSWKVRIFTASRLVPAPAR